MLQDILQPVDISQIQFADQFEFNQIINHLTIYKDEFPDLSKVKIAIVGIDEDRNALNGYRTGSGVYDIRKQFYQLFNHQSNLAVADLGNIKLNSKASDSYQALKIVTQELFDLNIVPLIIGGSQDLTYGQFLGQVDGNNLINLAVIDERIDLYSSEDGISNNSYLFSMLDHASQNLYNISVIGYQQHLVDPLVVETLHSLHFDSHRLGHLKQNMRELEPAIRNADIVSFDMRAIRQADAPGALNQSPNGFNGEQACQVAWYAGISDRVSSIGFYEYMPEFDYYDQTAKLVAQMMWYFIDGFHARKQDEKPPKEETLKYTVSFSQNDHHIEFIKSKRSDRWWMRVPIEKEHSKKLRRHEMVPCSYEDYEHACREEIPERWLRAYEKINHWYDNRVDVLD